MARPKMSGLPVILLIIVIIYGGTIGMVDAKECYNLDIRNHIGQFEQLRNCTVVIGYLNIVLMERVRPELYENLSFPELREITGMMVVFRVFGLKSFRTLFPNLTVIRGQYLLANYALVVYEMPQLENLGFKSLLTIQRGYVRIEKCIRLCYANTIDWDRITGTRIGANYIQKDIRSDCPNTTSCVGCDPELCWSQHNCQRFEAHHYKNCDPKCLGGCRNGACFICRGITDDDNCVESCEPPKLLNTLSVRCVTEAACREERRIVHDGKCLSECPIGFMNVTNKCHRCKDSSCPKTCYGMQIDFIENAEKLRGCTVINGSLQIKLNTDLADLYEELEENLREIREIRGFLKIYRSSPISSLSFMKKLKVIHGDVLENNQFALAVYENSNLQKLFNFDYNRDELKIMNGGMMFHYNQKLCFSEIQYLQSNTRYNKSLDYISKESNGYKHACNMESIKTEFEILSTTNVSITWERYNLTEGNTVKGYLIYYIEAPNENEVETYFGRDSCSRHSWRSELLTLDDLLYDVTQAQYSYTLTNLHPSTRYAYYVRSFLATEGINAQSIVKYIRMPIDKPSPPVVHTLMKTSDSVTLGWVIQSSQASAITQYNIEVHPRPYSKPTLDMRNYCDHPRTDETVEDDEVKHCCSEHDEETYEILRLHTSYETNLNCDEDPFQPGCHLFEYDRFKRELELLVLQCHLYHGHNSPICRTNTRWSGKRDGTASDSSSSLYRLERNVSNFTVPNLAPYTLYTFQVFACIDDFTCSPYYSHNERTAVDIVADLPRNVSIISEPDSEDSSVAFHFIEPLKPNGFTVAYKVEVRRMGTPNCETICITRLEHEMNNNISRHSTFDLSPGLYGFRVRAISLAMDGPWSEFVFYQAEEKHMSTAVQVTISVICVGMVTLAISCGVFWWMRHHQQDLPKQDDTTGLMSDVDEPPQAEDDELLEMHELIRERQQEEEMSRAVLDTENSRVTFHAERSPAKSTESSSSMKSTQSSPMKSTQSSPARRDFESSPVMSAQSSPGMSTQGSPARREFESSPGKSTQSSPARRDFESSPGKSTQSSPARRDFESSPGMSTQSSPPTRDFHASSSKSAEISPTRTDVESSTARMTTESSPAKTDAESKSAEEEDEDIDAGEPGPWKPIMGEVKIVQLTPKQQTRTLPKQFSKFDGTWRPEAKKIMKFHLDKNSGEDDLAKIVFD
ncbi:insulin receptor-like isoform X2 [Lutzomyia longipalpis]|uniref:insulin receptor-like isoform X2 n=1 Tax=Lutzomyia longipalpis TaxID=7200 RepID=UPI0024833ED7|nr:insulin receptor-like isoform X2 [Lutzomyia longipalpis]